MIAACANVAAQPRSRQHGRVYADMSTLPPSQSPAHRVGAAPATATGVLVSSSVRVDVAFVDAAPTISMRCARAGSRSEHERIVVERPTWRTSDHIRDAKSRGCPRLGAVGTWMEGNMPFGHDLEGATPASSASARSARRREARAFEQHASRLRERPRTDDEQTGASYRPFEALLAERIAWCCSFR